MVGDWFVVITNYLFDTIITWLLIETFKEIYDSGIRPHSRASHERCNKLMNFNVVSRANNWHFFVWWKKRAMDCTNLS